MKASILAIILLVATGSAATAALPPELQSLAPISNVNGQSYPKNVFALARNRHLSNADIDAFIGAPGTVWR